MAYEITWHENAKENYRDLISYLLDSWGDSVAEKFNNDLFAKLQVLESHHNIGIASRKISSLRKLIISSQNSLFYTVVENKVIILNIIDNRIGFTHEW